VLQSINAPGGPGDRHKNCYRCAIALDATLDGRPAQATGEDSVDLTIERRRSVMSSFLEHFPGRQLNRVPRLRNVRRQILAGGDGARGIVVGFRPINRSPHFFNVVNHHGTVIFLDGQTGRTPALGRGYFGFAFMRTN
jgi:hypothetical protein